MIICISVSSSMLVSIFVSGMGDTVWSPTTVPIIKQAVAGSHNEVKGGAGMSQNGMLR